ncbi:MAG: hypothetical protein HRU41_17755 [Saprospiraceae bacterium]|nr:hypothetical protein [Saprospiraceae bacterium]
MKTYVKASLLGLLLLLGTNCKKEDVQPGDGDKPNNPIQTPTEEQLRNQIAETFPFTPNQPLDAVYQCGRLNSQLLWYFVLQPDQKMQVLFTTDAHQDFAFEGTYSYQNDQLRLQMPAGPTMPFPNGLDESSTVIMPQFGTVAAFATDNMICLCDGHNLNTQQPPKVQANYDCPIINIQGATDEDNAIEFVHREIPFDLPVPGSIFRQQDIYVSGAINPSITRAFGIYRQQGNKFYASFSIASDFVDFAGDKLPIQLNINPPFADHNIISGEFQNNGQAIVVDQLKPEEGACNLR